MPEPEDIDAEFRALVEGVGPLLVTDDVGVWDFFHGIIQTWDSLNMREAMSAAIEADAWFREFVDDPVAWCERIADEWVERDALPEWLRDWVRAHLAGIVDFMRDHELDRLRLWVNVPGDDWLYMLWESYPKVVD